MAVNYNCNAHSLTLAKHRANKGERKMAFTKLIEFPNGTTANYHRIVNLNWREVFEGMVDVEQPNPAFVDEETTPEESATIMVPKRSHTSLTVVEISSWLDEAAYNAAKSPMKKIKLAIPSETSPMGHSNLPEGMYAQIQLALDTAALASPEFAGGVQL